MIIYQSGVAFFFFPEDPPYPEIEPGSPALQVDLTIWATRKASYISYYVKIQFFILLQTQFYGNLHFHLENQLPKILNNG